MVRLNIEYKNNPRSHLNFECIGVFKTKSILSFITGKDINVKTM